MFTLHREEVQSPALVQPLQAEPVLLVYRRLVQGQHLPVLAGRVELKVRRLLGLHHVVLVEHHHHEVDEVLDLGFVLQVPVLHLVVDGGEVVGPCGKVSEDPNSIQICVKVSAKCSDYQPHPGCIGWH